MLFDIFLNGAAVSLEQPKAKLTVKTFSRCHDTEVSEWIKRQMNFGID